MPSKDRKYPVKCKMCGEDKFAYLNQRDGGKMPEYCSNRCRNKARRTLAREDNCIVCGRLFEYKFDKYFVRRGVDKICSPSCKSAAMMLNLREKRRKPCTNCGEMMYPGFLKGGGIGTFHGKTRFCSDECARKYRWDNRSGRGKQNDGYVTLSKTCLYGKGLEFANAMVKGDSILEHRLVMALDLDRPLEKGEVVHHINGDPSDNRIENLMLQDWNVHSLTHKDNNRLVLKLKKRIAQLEREVDRLRQNTLPGSFAAVSEVA